VDNTVSVISGQTNTVTATIRVGLDPRGVAANPKTNTIYVANSGSNTVSVLGS
jgi:YVTN family beta-propeller protein